MKIEAPGFAERVLFAELPVLKTNDTGWETPSFDSNSGRHYRDRIFSPGTVTSTVPGSLELEYASADESVCTIDQSGIIKGVGPGECRVTLSATAEDYLDRVISKSATLLELNQFSDIVWGFPTSATVGVDTAALAAPVAKDADGNDVTDAGLSVTIASYSQSRECFYDPSARTILFGGPAECDLSVTASLSGYADYTKVFRVTPTEGDMQLTWDGYANNNVATFGATPPAPVSPATDPTGIGADYTYAAGGGGCEVDGDSGALTLLGADKAGRSCEVTVTGSFAGYADSSITHTVTVNKGSQTLTLSFLYGRAWGMETGESLDVINPPTGGHGDLLYAHHSGDCSVNAATGRITAGSTAEQCYFKVQWAGDENYNPSNEVRQYLDIFTQGNGATPTWIAAPYGSSNPTVGGSAVSLAAGAISNTASGNGALDYRSKTPTICRVDNATGALTGLAAGACVAQARFQGTSVIAASAWVDSPDITVDKGTHPAPAADPYGASASVKFEGTLELVTPPKGYGSATYSTTDSTCTVDATTGVITGAYPGDCTIQVAFAGDANYNALAASDLQTVTVAPGTQVVSFSDPYGPNPTVAVGEDLVVVTRPTTSVVVGSDDDGGERSYQVKSGLGTCSVTETSGIVTGLAPGDCIIEARAEEVTRGGNPAAIYAPSEWVEIATIAVGEGTLIGISWTPGASESRVGEELELAAVDVGDSGATVRYRVADAGESGCAFKGTSGTDAHTLVFEDRGSCAVTAVAERSGYAAWEQEHTIDVDLGIFEVADEVWGRFRGALPVGGSTLAPHRSAAVPDGVSITYSLLRGERECRLVNYRTGEVQGLPVRLNRQERSAYLSVFKGVDVSVVRFTAKAVGTGGNSITVTIENGSNSDKKYTVTDGNTPEVYDDVALGDLEAAMSGSALVDVSVADLTEEPANATATNLAGGTVSDKASLVFTRRGQVGVARLSAKAAGAGGTPSPSPSRPAPMATRNTPSMKGPIQRRFMTMWPSMGWKRP